MSPIFARLEIDLCTPMPGPEIEEIRDVGTTSWLREPISVWAVSALVRSVV